MERTTIVIIMSLSVASLVTARWCDSHYETDCTDDVCEAIEDGQICTRRDRRCIRSNTVECIHGDCAYTGCRCDVCWDGLKCDVYKNDRYPIFSMSDYDAIVSTGSRGALRGITAFDDDSPACVLEGIQDCPCAKIYFTIVDSDDMPWRFRINARTGDLSYDVTDIWTDTTFVVEIAAVNTHENGTVDDAGDHAGFVMVTILVSDTEGTTRGDRRSMAPLHPRHDVTSWTDGPDVTLFQHRHRRRRAAGPGLPISMEVSLVKLFPWESITTARPTDAIQFQFTVSLPEGAATFSVSVHSSIVASSVFQICDPIVTYVGTNIVSLLPADVTAQKVTVDGATRFDKAIYTFNNVTNDAGDVINADASQIVLTFTAVTLDSDLLMSGENYSVFVAAGSAEGGYLVKEAQLEYQDMDTDGGHGYNMSLIDGPSELLAGASGTWLVDVVLLVGVSALSVSAVGVAPNEINICDLSLVREGASLACYDEGPLSAKTVSGGLLLNFGDVVNTGYNMGNAINDLDRSITVRVIGSLPHNAVLGDIYTLRMNAVKNGAPVSLILHNITVSDSVPNPPAILPTLQVSATPTTIQVGGTHTLVVRIGTSPNYAAPYNITFRAADGSTFTLGFCGAAENSTGDNLSCGDTSMTPSVLTETRDQVTVVYPVLSNTGKLPEAAANDVVVMVTFLLVDDGSVSAGDIISVTAKLTTGGTDIMASVDLTAQVASSTGGVISSAVTNTGGVTDIYVGGQASYDVTLTLAPLSVYNDVELTVTANNRPFLQEGICSVTVGSADFCYLHTQVNTTANTFNPLYNDVMTLRIGTLINSQTTPAAITIRVVVVVLSDTIVSGDVLDTKIVLAYNGLTTDVEPASSTFSTLVPAIAQTPTFIVSQTLPGTAVMVDGVAVFDLEMTIPRSTMTSYKVIVVSHNPEVSICRVRLQQTGSNIPCLSDDIEHLPTAYASGEGNEQIQYDLFTVGNMDIHNDSEADILRLEVAAEFWDGFVSDGISYGIRFEVYYSGLMWSTIKTFSVNISASANAPNPTFTLEKHDGIHQITRGSATVYVINIYTSPKSSSSYSVNVTTERGVASIGDIRVISGGDHVPCLNDDGMAAFSSDDGNITFYSATKDIGVVPNAALNGPTQIDANKIRVEVIVGVPAGASVTEGQSSTIKVILVYGPSQTTLEQSLSYTITLNSIPQQVNSDVSITAILPKPPPVYSYMREVQTWGVQLVLPETTDNFVVNVSLPKSAGAAIMTGIDAVVSFVGPNIAFPANVDVLTTLVYGLGNSQPTTLILNLRRVSNVGTFNRYQFRRKNVIDDVVTIDIRIQIADHALNIHNAVQSLTFGLTSDGGAVYTLVQSLTIQLTGSEKADLILAVWTQGFVHSEKTSGDQVPVYGSVRHTNTSDAYATNVVVHIKTPYLSSYAGPCYWTCTQPSVTVLSAGKGITLQFLVITFTDVPTFEFNITLDPQRSLPEGLADVESVTIADMTYYTYQRASRADTAVHFTPLIELKFGFDSPLCNDRLGTDTVVQDCQVLASSSTEGRTPDHLKLNSSDAWLPVFRGSPYKSHEYIQVNWGTAMKVNVLVIMSSGDENINYVTSFTIQYSYDGNRWNDVTVPNTNVAQVFSVSFDDTIKQVNDKFFIPLNESYVFTARLVRLIPKSSTYVGRPAMRAEFVGCEAETANDTDPCADPPTKPFEQSDRLYVVDTIAGTIYACILTQIDDVVQCSSSDDNGETWTELDLTVGNVNGVLPNTSMTGVSADGFARLCSWDTGYTWISCDSDQYDTIVTDATYIQAVEIPFIDLTGQTNDALHVVYGFSTPTHLITGDSMTGVTCGAGDAHSSGTPDLTFGFCEANNNGLAVRTISGSWSQVLWWGDSDWDVLHSEQLLP